MISEKQILNTVLEEGQTQASIGMSLDMESAHVLMQMLSKNLYSDPVGSTVRECASNALDSHRRAGIKEPIIVSLKVNDQNNFEFSVEDFGLGLDANDVVNIISKYGKSTKRDKADELGMMGLGFKSPLAYASSFYFVCRKDGMERKYMMYEAEEVNTIDLLYETPTTERNGVKVIVPVRYMDRNSFLTKIKNQLAYFEDVYFDVNVNNSVVTNNFNIYRADSFQISQMNTDDFVHICLDNVYYPLDFTKLGITPIKIPIGLRFNLTDGLFPTPNREQLIYTSNAIKTINERLVKVADFMVEKYNEFSIDCKNLREIFDFYASDDRYIDIGDATYNITAIAKFSKIPFKKPEYADYKLTDFKNLYRNRDYMFYGYKNHMMYSKGRFTQLKSTWDMTVNYNQFKDPSRLFVYDEKFVGNKKSYIKSLLPQNDYTRYYFMRKDKAFSLRQKDKNNTMDNYFNMLDLRKYPKDTWRARIVEFESIVSELTKDIRIIETIDIPQSWLDARKKVRISTAKGGTKRLKVHGEMNCRRVEELQRYVEGKNSKLTPGLLKMEDIESQKWLTVYGKDKDSVLIDQLYSVSSKQNLRYLILSEREYKVAESLDLHNFISIDKFMEGKNKPFKRIITAYLIQCLISTYSDTFNKRHILNVISRDLFDRINLLLDYHRANYHRIGDEDVYKAMLVIAEDHKLFDETIFTEYSQLKELLDGFPFIETTLDMMCHNANEVGKERFIDVLRDLFKYHRIRMDYTNYKLKLNDDLTEKLEQAVLDQLTLNS